MGAVAAIRTSGLTKRYDETVALDGLDLAVEPALAFALVPRASASLTYSLVGAAFLLELLGSLLELPGWVLSLSPFHDIGLVPGEPFEPVAAAIMVALALLAAAAAIVLFAAATSSLREGRCQAGGSGGPMISIP